MAEPQVTLVEGTVDDPVVNKGLPNNSGGIGPIPLEPLAVIVSMVCGEVEIGAMKWNEC